jgi:hypothetical protein
MLYVIESIGWTQVKAGENFIVAGGSKLVSGGNMTGSEKFDFYTRDEPGRKGRVCMCQNIWYFKRLPRVVLLAHNPTIIVNYVWSIHNSTFVECMATYK